MVPSEWSTGQKERRGSITKSGECRRSGESLWRDGLADGLGRSPSINRSKNGRGVPRGSNPALEAKKAVVAIGRQLIVDLWRWETGRVTAQELNLVMIEAQGV